MNLYYGKNDSHEFWENEGGTYLIIRHHGHDQWFALRVAGEFVMGLATAKRPQTIANRIQRHYGIGFQFDESKQWALKRKNAKRMQLVPTVQSVNGVSQPCADCGVKPRVEHLPTCNGGNHLLVSRAGRNTSRLRQRTTTKNATISTRSE